MKFLEAKRLLKKLPNNAPTASILFATSFESTTFDAYLKGNYAKHGYRVDIEHLPFGTLQQFLYQGSQKETIAALCPWDFYTQLDWRRGYISDTLPSLEIILESIRNTVALLSKHIQTALYIDTVGKPFGSTSYQDAIHNAIRSELLNSSIDCCFTSSFDLELYFSTGQPLSGGMVSSATDQLNELIFKQKPEPKKVIVTDLDFTLWHGVIGEVGQNGIEYSNEGSGYPHFIYQSCLKILKDKGALIAVVSKNDQDLVDAALVQSNMTLAEDDFVAVIANYEAKSAQISHLADQLNLGLDAFIFIDDNPVEIAEVSAALPTVTCLQFSTEQGSLIDVLNVLKSSFPDNLSSMEDTNRTELYRTRIKGIKAVEAAGHDLQGFLEGLDMQLSVVEKDASNYHRALQLINKTNQFTLNGLRLSDKEMHSLFDKGARLFTADLSDCHGSHGEIAAAIILEDTVCDDVYDNNAIHAGEILYFAMSCRVMQRQVEAVFLSVLAEELVSPHLMLNYLKTDRNTPIAKFLISLTDDLDRPIKSSDLVKLKASLAALFNIKVKTL